MDEVARGDLVEISCLDDTQAIRMDILHMHNKQPTGTALIVRPGTVFTGVVTGFVENKTKYLMGLHAEGWITRKGYQIFAGDVLVSWDDGIPNSRCRLLMKSNGVKMVEEDDSDQQR